MTSKKGPFTSSDSDASAMTLQDRSQIKMYGFCHVLLHLIDATLDADAKIICRLEMALQRICERYRRM